MAHTQKHRRKMPSFSSSLLDAIYHSIDNPVGGINDPKESEDFRKNNSSLVDQEIESLRRAIRLEKWMEKHTSTTTPPRQLSSYSGSSTDSTVFSSSETERPEMISQPETMPKREGRFTRTTSRALKIYGDLKRVKEPISPRGKIANFLNSIFSPRNLKKPVVEECGQVSQSRSMKDTTSSSPWAMRSCLNRNPNKSKRSVTFCPVSVIPDEDSQACGQKTIHGLHDEYVGGRFIKKNKESSRRHEFDMDQFCEDDESCGSSDLFELENIGRAYVEELPVYGTTSVKMNQAIAGGFIM